MSERWVLAFVGVTISAVVLNGTMVPVALPQIGSELSLGPGQVGWLITGYFLVLGIAVPFFGRLADLHGVGRLYAMGLTPFLAGSVACALAPVYSVLLGGRLVQGLGAAAVAGLAPTAISLAYSFGRQGGALGLAYASAGAAGAAGPVLGGILTETLGWRYLFMAGILVGVLAPLAPRVLPEGTRESSGSLNWWGGLLLGIAVAGALLALTRGAETGWHDRLVLLYSGTTLAAAVLFVLQQRVSSSPFIPRVLLIDRTYVHLGVLTLLLLGIYLTMESVAPLPLANANGLSASRIGLVLLPPALVNAAWGLFAGKLVDRYGVRLPLLAASGAATIGLLALSAFGVGGPLWLVSGLLAVVIASGTLARVAVIKGVSLTTPKEHLSSGISINEMVWMLGVSLGTALFVATAAARSETPEGLNPLYSGGFAGYSDAFLVLAVSLLLALLASLKLNKTTGSR